MSRHAPAIIVFVMLGAMANIGVAWACAAWVSMDEVAGEITSGQLGPGLWESTYVQSRLGHTRVNIVRGPVRFDQQRGRVVDRDVQDGARRWRAARVAVNEELSQQALAGWPLRAFRCERAGFASIIMPGRFGFWSTSPNTSRSPRGGIEIESNHPRWVVLPYSPIWPGAIVNTLVYAAATAMLLSVPRAVRRRFRRRRALCPDCGYPIGISHTCSECGAPLTRTFAA